MTVKNGLVRTKTKGTKEWAIYNINFIYGCSRNCKYCYAKANWVMNRKGKGLPPNSWGEMMFNYRLFSQTIPKIENQNPNDFYDIMCPTSHDITEDLIELEENEIQQLRNDRKITLKGYEMLMKLIKIKTKWSVVELYIIKAKEILDLGYTLLITSKPRISVIRKLCEELKDYKDRICYRFTITSMNDELREEWESNAPTFSERLECLKYAFDKGFKTSISAEPFLDGNPIPMIKMVAPYINDTIWIGKMSGRNYEHHSVENIKKIIQELNTLKNGIFPKLRLKDSLKNMGFSLTNRCPKCNRTMRKVNTSINILGKLVPYKLGWKCRGCGYPKDNKYTHNQIKEYLIS